MAVRKKTVQAQFTEAITPLLEPGEQIVVGVMSQTGPSPWLAGAVGIVVMLLMGARWYYLAVAGKRLIVMKASMWTSRPKGLAWSEPLSSLRLQDVVTDAKVWQSFKLQRPDGSPLLRFNVSKVIWKDEYLQLVAELQAGSVPPAPTG